MTVEECYKPDVTLLLLLLGTLCRRSLEMEADIHVDLVMTWTFSC